MRDEIDAILSFIGTSSLTNEEFNDLTLTEPYTQQELYSAIYSMFITRGEAQNIYDNLYYYFKAKGETFNQAKTAQSNIFIGDTCEPL